VSSAAKTSDAGLVALCRTGDGDAWEEFVNRFDRYVHGVAAVYRLSVPDADDVVQEVFVRSYQRLDELRDDGAVRTWLGRLAARLCIDRLRARAREVVCETPLAESGTAAALAELEQRLTLEEAVDRLPDHCREVIERFFAQDESYRAIGDELGLAAGTVASRISRCVGRLRQMLAEASGGSPVTGVDASTAGREDCGPLARPSVSDD